MNRKFLWLAFAGLFVCTTMQAQKTKKKKKNGSLTSIVCHEEVSCCENENKKEALATDAAFLQTAGTAAFGQLHEEPVAITPQDPKGNMILYNCSDGQPGMGYYIPPADVSMNFLIVIQEWWGLNDHIKQEADKLHAALGGNLHVLAVDLYDGKIAATVDSAQKLIGEALRSNRKETILQGAMDYAGRGANVFTMGWCFGGMMSLQTAILGGDRVKGAIMYYGQPEKDPQKLAAIRCDVLGIFGTKDRGIPNELVDEFATNMAKAGKNFELVRYEAVHAFANPSNPQYNKAFGDDAFKKSVDFLKARMR